MKKTFPLHLPGHADQRVLEAIKGDVRKYIKREQRKALPTGVDFWDFACKVGQDQLEPVAKHSKEIIPAIDAAAKNEAKSVYVEILAIPGHRMKKAVEATAGEDVTTNEPSIESDPA